MINPIRAVYEQYKHLDHLLSDHNFLDPPAEVSDDDDTRLSRMYGHYLADFWQAIKAHIEAHDKWEHETKAARASRRKETLEGWLEQNRHLRDEVCSGDWCCTACHDLLLEPAWRAIEAHVNAEQEVRL